MLPFPGIYYYEAEDDGEAQDRAEEHCGRKNVNIRGKFIDKGRRSDPSKVLKSRPQIQSSFSKEMFCWKFSNLSAWKGVPRRIRSISVFLGQMEEQSRA